jgi:hypothetical protein
MVCNEQNLSMFQGCFKRAVRDNVLIFSHNKKSNMFKGPRYLTFKRRVEMPSVSCAGRTFLM